MQALWPRAVYTEQCISTGLSFPGQEFIHDLNTEYENWSIISLFAVSGLQVPEMLYPMKSMGKT